MRGISVYWIVGLMSFYVLQAQDNFNFTEVAHISQEVLCNDIWGFVDSSGTEYAILGTQVDTRIYSLENPEAPALRKTIPGTNSVWRDFKSFGNYIYSVADQGLDGLTIIDMTHAPDSITSRQWKGPTLNGTILERCHNLYIDTRGYAYLAGCNPGNRGVLILDLTGDPGDPVYIGAENERYAHDVIVQGDLLFASEIRDGALGMYNISDIDSIYLVSRTRTSANFTHNAWPSDDGKYVFTTDELPNGFVDAYDISDLENPVRIDTYQPVQGGNITPHNTHYYNGYLVTSWYTEGVIILDASRPDILVRTGQFDTNPQNDNGCWGVYPFLPSGLILASDLDNGLFVLRPDYIRARLLEGVVTDASTGLPINNVSVRIIGEDSPAERTNASGDYRTGTALSGNLSVVFSHPEYLNDTVMVNPDRVSALNLDNSLVNIKYVDIIGRVTTTDGNAIPNAQIEISSGENVWLGVTDEAGFFANTILEGNYSLAVGSWGYQTRLLTLNTDGQADTAISLEAGYEDDFLVDLGWTTSGEATSGLWQRAIPKGTTFEGLIANPDRDLPGDLGDYAYVTGNDDRSAGFDDVDNGTTILTSPPFFIENMTEPVLHYNLWFFNNGGDLMPNDFMSTYLVAGARNIPLEVVNSSGEDGGYWRDASVFNLKDLLSADEWSLPLSLVIEIGDDPENGHLVEGGFDGFKVLDSALTTPVVESPIENINIFPNPGNGIYTVTSKGGMVADRIEIYDASGRRLSHSSNGKNTLDLSAYRDGLYFIVLTQDQKSSVHKIIKLYD